ncbi:hypothetical protein [Kingella oralis]|uniref:Uncharacterized protein n=1 Tax=Kingella oralis ATCC 51147 TaxID=629741 RepID=C4GEU7_9NEIS|nr:hypothetical protein [Kingella oralis]EEP68752.1 hypothetical protein GCWU000324_00656 [Kingella oralis ATCC 51147]
MPHPNRCISGCPNHTSKRFQAAQSQGSLKPSHPTKPQNHAHPSHPL